MRRNKKMERMSRKDVCSIEACDSKILAKGLCGKHYQREIAKTKRVNDCACGCGEKTQYTFKHGHHTRLFSKEEQRRRGLHNTGDTQRAKGDLTSTHYRKLRGVHEHRIVAEQIIGRPLKYEDVVHHINNNKRDNRIENLQIITRSEHINIHVHGIELC
jgi:hypothetical protein